MNRSERTPGHCDQHGYALPPSVSIQWQDVESTEKHMVEEDRSGVHIMTVAVAVILGAILIAFEVWYEINKR